MASNLRTLCLFSSYQGSNHILHYSISKLLVVHSSNDCTCNLHSSDGSLAAHHFPPCQDLRLWECSYGSCRGKKILLFIETLCDVWMYFDTDALHKKLDSKNFKDHWPILLPGNIAGLSQMLEPLLWLMGSVFWVWETWVLTEWAFQWVNSRSTQLWRASSPTSVCPSLLTWEPTHKYVNSKPLLVLVKYFSLTNNNNCWW